MKPPRPDLDLLTVFAAVLCPVLVGLAGCDSRTPPGGAGPGPSGEADAPVALETATATQKAAHVRELEKGLREIQKGLSKKTARTSLKLRTLRAFIVNAKNTEARLGKKLQVVLLAEKALQDMLDAQKTKEEEVFRELEVAVLQVLSEPAPDLRKANALIEAFPEDRYKNSDILPEIEELKDQVNLYSRAELDAISRKFKAESMDDPVQVVAILEGFDPEFSGTPYAKEIEALISESYKKYVESRAATLTKLAEADWIDMDLEGYRLLWSEEYDCTRVEDSVLTVGPNVPEYVEQDGKDLALAAGTCIQLGDDDWEDLEIQFEAQVVAGAGIFLGARGGFRDDNYNFSWLTLEKLGIDDDEWHEIWVLIEGRQMRVTDTTGGKVTQTQRLRRQKGPFGIRVTGPDAVIRLRKLRIWTKKKATVEGEEKEGTVEGEEKDGSGSGG